MKILISPVYWVDEVYKAKKEKAENNILWMM